MREQITEQLNRPACHNCEHLVGDDAGPSCLKANAPIPHEVFAVGCEFFEQQIPF